MIAIVQQIFIWFFGILTVALLAMALVSIFRHGSSFLRVSEKAEKISHFYMLSAGISLTFWFVIHSPDLLTEGLLCLLPMVIIVVGLSYGMSLFNRNLLKRAFKKGIHYPFKDKKQ
jgi:hypothetical protein